MDTKLTLEDGRQSLTSHLASKGFEIREKYGPLIGLTELRRILDDRSACRYPCSLVFDDLFLQPGEFAYPRPVGDRPEDGFTIYVHPIFALDPDRVPYLVLYQLVQVNYGDFATAADAETFGAQVLGLTQEVYYQSLCEMADQLPEGASSTCSCHG